MAFYWRGHPWIHQALPQASEESQEGRHRDGVLRGLLGGSELAVVGHQELGEPSHQIRAHCEDRFHDQPAGEEDRGGRPAGAFEDRLRRQSRQREGRVNRTRHTPTSHVPASTSIRLRPPPLCFLPPTSHRYLTRRSRCPAATPLLPSRVGWDRGGTQWPPHQAADESEEGAPPGAMVRIARTNERVTGRNEDTWWTGEHGKGKGNRGEGRTGTRRSGRRPRGFSETVEERRETWCKRVGWSADERMNTVKRNETTIHSRTHRPNAPRRLESWESMARGMVRPSVSRSRRSK
eukprot:scaffold358_cov343-Pavlova_lutheri.AAC.14